MTDQNKLQDDFINSLLEACGESGKTTKRIILDIDVQHKNIINVYVEKMWEPEAIDIRFDGMRFDIK